MRGKRFAGCSRHLVDTDALVLKLLLKTVDLALQTQYVLLLGSQSVIQRLYRVLNERDLGLQRSYVPQLLTPQAKHLRVLL